MTPRQPPCLVPGTPHQLHRSATTGCASPGGALPSDGTDNGSRSRWCRASCLMNCGRVRLKLRMRRVPFGARCAEHGVGRFGSAWTRSGRPVLRTVVAPRHLVAQGASGAVPYRGVWGTRSSPAGRGAEPRDVRRYRSGDTTPISQICHSRARLIRRRSPERRHRQRQSVPLVSSIVSDELWQNALEVAHAACAIRRQVCGARSRALRVRMDAKRAAGAPHGRCAAPFGCSGCLQRRSLSRGLGSSQLPSRARGRAPRRSPLQFLGVPGTPY